MHNPTKNEVAGISYVMALRQVARWRVGRFNKELQLVAIKMNTGLVNGCFFNTGYFMRELQFAKPDLFVTGI